MKLDEMNGKTKSFRHLTPPTRHTHVYSRHFPIISHHTLAIELLRQLIYDSAL